jgi:ABC-type spermidine/putrescine transport system permease subunit II
MLASELMLAMIFPPLRLTAAFSFNSEAWRSAFPFRQFGLQSDA